MLNLSELEQKLDKALSAETEVSLTVWLLSKREKCLEFLGEGHYETLNPKTTVIEPNTSYFGNHFEFSNGFSDVGENNSLAA